LYDILKEYKNKLPKVLIHCYDSNSEWVQKFNEFNCYFAFGGKVTFPKSDYLREALIYIPENRLVCETDSPWLSPWPNRSKKNEPANVIAIVEYISNLLKNDKKSIIFNNSVELFNLPHKN
jgi:TatD DNase family protein